MINFIISENFYSLFAGIGLMAAFLMTCVCITKFNYLLPKDAGRDFAHDGKLSAGKPRGAGIIFILVFAAAALLFSELSVEIVIYIVLVIAEMLTEMCIRDSLVTFMKCFLTMPLRHPRNWKLH